MRLQNARGVERQQLKWFSYATAVLLGAFALGPVAEQTGEPWAAFVLVMIGLSAIPVAVGIAILKYRLYDIDILINPTLVYGSLTVLLVAVYFGGVAATQGIFLRLTGQRELPQLAIVASTLLIAALFQGRDRSGSPKPRSGGSGCGDYAARACLAVVATRRHGSTAPAGGLAALSLGKSASCIPHILAPTVL